MEYAELFSKQYRQCVDRNDNADCVTATGMCNIRL